MLLVVSGLADAAWAALWPCLRLGGAVVSWWAAVSVGIQVSSHLAAPPLAGFSSQESVMADVERRVAHMLPGGHVAAGPHNVTGWTLLESYIVPPGGNWYTFAAEKAIVLVGGWAVARLRR